MLHSTERIKRGNTGRKICNLGRKGLWGGRGRNLSDRMVSLYATGENKDMGQNNINRGLKRKDKWLGPGSIKVDHPKAGKIKGERILQSDLGSCLAAPSPTWTPQGISVK